MQNCYSEYFETYCLYELHMIFCHFNISYSIMHQHVGPWHDVFSGGASKNSKGGPKRGRVVASLPPHVASLESPLATLSSSFSEPSSIYASYLNNFGCIFFYEVKLKLV